MVKKKVVRKDSSRAKPKKVHKSKHQSNVLIKAEKPKVRRHAIIKSLVESKAAHNQAKLESLELAANIAVKDTTETEPVIEKKVEVKEEPVKVVEEIKEVKQPKSESTDVPPDTAIVQPDPLFADDVKPDFPVNKVGEGITKGMRITVLVVTTIILLFWFILISMSLVANPDRMTEQNITVTITEPITINFERYANATSAVSVTDSSLVGYLREEMTSGDREAALIKSFYIVDDYGNKVKLDLGTKVAEYDLIFKLDTTTEKTYNLTGAFRYNQYDSVKYVFKVDDIIQQDRPTHTIDVKRLENVTVEGKGFKIDIVSGWKKIIGK